MSFQTQQVWNKLEEKVVERKVGKTGTVSINDRGYGVGGKHRGKTISIKIDKKTKEYVFMEEGIELGRKTIKEIELKKLCGEEAPTSRRRSHGKKAN